MPLESALYINTLNSDYPVGSDTYQATDDHIRLIKETLLNSFPNITGVVNASDEDFNKLQSLAISITSVQSAVIRVSAKVSALESDVVQLNADITNAQANVTSHVSRMDDLSANVTTLSSSASAVDVRINSLSATLATIENAFYIGRVDLSGTAISLPTLWRSVQVATADYQVSHFLSIPTTYAVVSPGYVYSTAANHFRIRTSSSFSFVVIV